jgi:hypothetical protein
VERRWGGLRGCSVNGGGGGWLPYNISGAQRAGTVVLELRDRLAEVVLE